MAEVAQTRCAHPLCTCPVQAGEEYCSQACSDAVEDTAIAEGTVISDRCKCPHPQCASAMAA